MVGFGQNYPKKIHHRGSVLPSMDQHPQHIECNAGYLYFHGNDPNQNDLTGAVVGGPGEDDKYEDSRFDAISTHLLLVYWLTSKLYTAEKKSRNCNLVFQQSL